MNGAGSGDDVRSFESKVAELIAATRSLDIPQTLTVRRLTLADAEARKWASEKQLNVIFSVILTKVIERFGLPRLRESRLRGFADLLPVGEANRVEDLRVLSEAATQILGPEKMSEAETTKAAFQSLLEQVQVMTPQRTERTVALLREPPPLFAAQLGPAIERRISAMRALVPAAAADEEGGAEAAHPRPAGGVDFNILFDDTVCAYAQKTLSMFKISGASRGMRLPFLLSPEFGQAYRETLRRFVLPQMRATRHMQALAQSYNWSEVGADKLVEIIQGSEVNNPILHNWDARWASFRTPRPVKGRRPPPQRPEDNPWPLLREDATRYSYEPPGEDHVILMRDILRFESDVLAKCWREISQLYEQEFSPSGRQDQAREGALRDGMMKWVAKLPDNVGEHLAIKALFEFEKIDSAWLRRLYASFGRTESERRRGAPFLGDFVLQLGGF
jgi:hypothetical protein